MSILDTPGSPADHRVTLDQIGRGRLALLGARDFVHSDKDGQLWFFLGAGGNAKYTARKVIVKLNAMDTYDVEIGRMNRRTLDWESGEVITGIYAEQLGEAIGNLYERALDDEAT